MKRDCFISYKVLKYPRFLELNFSYANYHFLDRNYICFHPTKIIDLCYYQKHEKFNIPLLSEIKIMANITTSFSSVDSLKNAIDSFAFISESRMQTSKQWLEDLQTATQENTTISTSTNKLGTDISHTTTYKNGDTSTVYFSFKSLLSTTGKVTKYEFKPLNTNVLLTTFCNFKVSISVIDGQLIFRNTKNEIVSTIFDNSGLTKQVYINKDTIDTFTLIPEFHTDYWGAIGIYENPTTKLFLTQQIPNKDHTYQIKSFSLTANNQEFKFIGNVILNDNKGFGDLLRDNNISEFLTEIMSGNDKFTGTKASEYLFGYSGNDSISGGLGNDTLIGGLGKDTLTGGVGSDLFKFISLNDSSPLPKQADTITDFNHAQGDKIDLSDIDAKTEVEGDQAFTYIGTIAFSTDATGQLRLDPKTGILYGSTNADVAPEFAILLSGIKNLVPEDFVL
jgi:Ca2+-binding RTX toxin-like protein